MIPTVGAHVTWTTVWPADAPTTRTGRVIALVHPGEDARRKAPPGTNWSRVRARPIVRVPGHVRALVAVAGADGVTRYYAPECGRLEAAVEAGEGRR